MTPTWWRREGTGLRLLQGNKSRDKLLANDGVRALPPALAALTGPEA